MQKVKEKKELREKRLNLAFKESEYNFFKREAEKRGTSFAGLLRQAAIKLIQEEKELYSN